MFDMSFINKNDASPIFFIWKSVLQVEDDLKRENSSGKNIMMKQVFMKSGNFIM